MARFYGKVGYASSIESPANSGVWIDVMTEVSYFGDVVQNSRTMQQGSKVNDDLLVDVSISIVADAYASEQFFAIRYVAWAGTLWTVSNVEVDRPRLVLKLGGVYNGPTP